MLPQSFARLPPALRQALLAQYRAQLTEALAGLERAGAQGWPAPAASVTQAHRLGGSAGLMQDTPLAQAARALEQCLRAGDGAGASAQWALLAPLLRAALAHLSAPDGERAE